MPEEKEMEKKFTEREAHRHFAVNYFNSTWGLIEKEDRTPEEDFQLIHGAHASRCHWGVVGEPINLNVGEWQCSRVYAVLGRGEPALFHAKECLRICEKEGIGDFNIAFAHEAMARASAACGDKEGFETHYAKARELGEMIEKKEDRDYFFKDLEAGDWFEMR